MFERKAIASRLQEILPHIKLNFTGVGHPRFPRSVYTDDSLSRFTRILAAINVRSLLLINCYYKRTFVERGNEHCISSIGPYTRD